jgi:GNAT superfamily N-acetyltransferase
MLRKLGLSDMAAAALVHRATFDATLPTLAGLHTPEEDRWFYERRVFVTCEMWGAWAEDRLVGIIAFRPGWIDQLYVLPGAQSRGVGRRLLAVAQAANAELRLWTFQRNRRARRFYKRHGFVRIAETDGARNEEREPDALYRWTRACP